MRPLEGVKVIEMSMVISAPSCGKILYEQGAEVIKVETSDAGDNWRTTPRVYAQPITNDERPGFESLNSGKKMVKLNMKDPADVEKMKKMIAQADVFLTNYRTKAVEGMGLGYEAMKALNPKLVYATVTGYGTTGPMANDPGFDTTAFWAQSGAMLDLTIQNAEGTALPINGPVGSGDISVGAMLAQGICAALYKAEKTGEGSYVTCPLLGAGVWAFSQMSIGTQYGYKWPRTNQMLAPTNCAYMTADGDFIMTSMAKYNEQWPKFCHAYNMDEYANDPVFGDQAKTANLTIRAQLVDLITEKARACHTIDVATKLKEADIVYTILPHMEDMYKGELLHSKQAIANGDIVPFTYASGKELLVPKPPVRIDNEPARPHMTCGGVGADNEEVFAEFGI